MPRADRRLRSASSPTSVAVRWPSQEKRAFGAEICQACPRTLLSTISPTVQVDIVDSLVQGHRLTV